MFYIYGGGFYNGSAQDHPPKHLLEEDIVLVVTQYRVGALGWLSNFSEDMPGNVPAMDLIMALQWVQQHIRHFGGDSQQVTVFGQSAGAGMTGTLLLSPQTPIGLFKAAIIQSGSILANWAINREPEKQLQRIATSVKCMEFGNETTQQVIQCMRNINVLQLLQATTTVCIIYFIWYQGKKILVVLRNPLVLY